jgi:type IV secretion system protein VirB4
MSGRDTASLETGAGARAANASVDDLSGVVRALDKKIHGEFSLLLSLVANSPEQLREMTPAVHGIFVDARAQVMEETLGNFRVLRDVSRQSEIQCLPVVAVRGPTLRE